MPTISPQIEAYLHRLGFSSNQFSRLTSGSAEALSDLQYAHVHHVPYETLDILAGVPFSLDRAGV